LEAVIDQKKEARSEFHSEEKAVKKTGVSEMHQLKMG